MLLEMHLKELGVIAEAVLEFGPGLTVITGETGAGKTMVVTGLNLVLGGRADSGLVRAGAARATAEARVVVDPAGSVAARAEDAGAELDEDVLIVSRTLSAEGRGRAHLGGRGVPVGVLTELAGDLVAVHGQSDQLRLRSPQHQRQALDRFAGKALSSVLAEYRPRWRRLREVESTLAELTTQARERAAEAELLRLGLAEIERVAPQPGEDDELRGQSDRLAHAEELQVAARSAASALVGEEENWQEQDNALGLLTQARTALDAVREHDPRLAALADRLAEVTLLAQDAAADAASYAGDVEADPARLAAVEERRAAIGALTRSYGQNVAEVLEWSERSGRRLLELDCDDDRIQALADEREKLVAELGDLAARASAARVEAAAALAEQVSAELPALAMPKARLLVQVTQHEDDDGLPVPPGGRRLAAGSHGADEVELLLTPHPGAEPRPLAKGASGGELSRVMLGLEVVLGAADPVPTFVFDEVDSGVGGEAALGIGARLARLAQSSQVIVVTHLPQVAAFADRHLLVTKSADAQVTVSDVRTLEGEDRVTELARMLGGMASSASARAHAEELIAGARRPAAATRRRPRGRR